MLGRFQLGPRAGQHRIRIDQIGRCVSRAACLAVVAVLILRTAHRTRALDVTVRQEHAFDRIVKLLDRARRNQIVCLQPRVNRLRQCDVFRRIRRVPVIERDIESVQILLARVAHLVDELARRFAGVLRGNHDRGAMRVFGAHEVNVVAAHLLEPHPDVGLDVFHDVPDVRAAVCVRQRSGDEQVSLHRARHCKCVTW